jgi:hypothetical protein
MTTTSQHGEHLTALPLASVALADVEGLGSGDYVDCAGNGHFLHSCKGRLESNQWVSLSRLGRPQHRKLHSWFGPTQRGSLVTPSRRSRGSLVTPSRRSPSRSSSGVSSPSPLRASRSSAPRGVCCATHHGKRRVALRRGAGSKSMGLLSDGLGRRYPNRLRSQNYLVMSTADARHDEHSRNFSCDSNAGKSTSRPGESGKHPISPRMLRF